MKKLIFGACLIAVSIGAELALHEDENAVRSARDPRLIELELSLAKADLSLIRAGADQDEKREVFAEIIENQDWLDELHRRPEAEHQECYEPVELEVPLRDGRPAEEFLAEARQFMGELHAACSIGARTGAELDAARERFIKMEQNQHVRALKTAMEQAREELHARRLQEIGVEQEKLRVDLQGMDVDGLPLKERIPSLVAKIDLDLRDEGSAGDLDERRRRLERLDDLARERRRQRAAVAPDPIELVREHIKALEQELVNAGSSPEEKGN